MIVAVEEVRQAICARLVTMGGLASVWPYEPEQLGDLPASTLLMQRIDPRETATGPRLDVTWYWQLRIYVNLSDAQAAQRQLEELVFATLSLWRDDPTLADLVEWWKIDDTGEPPVFGPERKWLRKSVLVSAVIEHVPLP